MNVKIIIILLTLSIYFSSFDYLTQITSFQSFLASVYAQENPNIYNIDLNGVWVRDDGTQFNITQTGSNVIAGSDYLYPAQMG
jgi:hypothetical protein